MKAKTSRSGKTAKRAASTPRSGRMVSTKALPSRSLRGAARSHPKPIPKEPPLHRQPPPIPPILFEGDRPGPEPKAAQPAQQSAVKTTTPVEAGATQERSLPAAYGTRRLQLTARDPHWLYAHWDLTSEQQQQYNASSVDRHLVLRVHREAKGEPVAAEIHLRPESRHWFIQVQHAGAGYVTELGYYQPNRRWRSIATSNPVTTPPETIAVDKTVRWGLAPLRLIRPGPGTPAGRPIETGVPLVEGEPAPDSVSCPPPEPPSEWTPAQETALADVVAAALRRYRQSGSGEIPELIERGAAKEVPTSAVLGISSHLGGAGRQPREFWLNINAELVLYGATEPDAWVTIGGRPVALRPDGTFSCRFALPDGHHQVAVAAISVWNEFRQAELSFSRHTQSHGDIGAQPQDQALQPPGAGNAP